jgi:hypothetical protein
MLVTRMSRLSQWHWSLAAVACPVVGGPLIVPVTCEERMDLLILGTEDLAKLLGSHKVEEVKGTGFESQYKSVLDAVKQASNGTVKVFRVELEGTRAEYYVVGVNEKEGKIVGLKALAVES